MKSFLISTIKSTINSINKYVLKNPSFYISGMVVVVLYLFVDYGAGYFVAGLWLGYWIAKDAF